MPTLVGLGGGVVELEEADSGHSETHSTVVVAGTEHHNLGSPPPDRLDDLSVHEDRPGLQMVTER